MTELYYRIICKCFFTVVVSYELLIKKKKINNNNNNNNLMSVLTSRSLPGGFTNSFCKDV